MKNIKVISKRLDDIYSEPDGRSQDLKDIGLFYEVEIDGDVIEFHTLGIIKDPSKGILPEDCEMSIPFYRGSGKAYKIDRESYDMILGIILKDLNEALQKRFELLQK